MKNDVKSLVNTRKLFLVPITVVFIVILILGFFSMNYSETILKEKMINDGIIIAQQFADKISSSNMAAEIIKENYEIKVSEIGAYILANKNTLNNDFLRSIKEVFDMDEIYFYSPDGVVIYSATDEYIGWQAKNGDPIDTFMKSGLTEFHEEARKSTETDEWYKFSYFKNSDGYFVQVGCYLENYNYHTQKYELQRIIENESNKNNVFYILVTDKNLLSIADSDPEDIGTDWSDEEEYKAALSGKPMAFEWFYPQRNELILEVAVPIYENDDIVGILAYGSSLNLIRDELNNNLLRISLLLILTGIILVISQRQLILVPLQKLRANLNQFTLNDAYVSKIPINSKDPFLGVVESFNSAIDVINTHVTENNRVNAELSYAADYDFVTGMRNRRALMGYLSNLSLDKEKVAFCMLDLNGLKDINDVYGHNTGDMYIKTIAFRLSQLTEKIESFRFGGDEFFMIINESGARLTEVLQMIVERVSIPIVYNNETINVRFCIGVSQSILDGINADELIRKADIAMYNLKNRNEDGFRFYVESFNESIQFKEYIYKELVTAIENNGFKMLYQPIIENSTQNVISLEALLRLKNLSISPGIFIPIAESKGLIGKITYIVIDLVISQMSYWKKSGYEPIPVSINISPKLFVLDNLFDYIVTKLNQYDLNSHYLELEITEEILIDNKDSVVEYLLKYHDIGIKVSLDDFGSGYSSLNYLTYIPFDKIKLDKTIIDKYLNQTHFRIIKSIIDIVHELGLPIVAEGVELQQQRELLSENGCDQMQGYLFSKPVDDNTIEQNYLKKMTTG